jgi:hypothetical protein
MTTSLTSSNLLIKPYIRETTHFNINRRLDRVKRRWVDRSPTHATSWIRDWLLFVLVEAFCFATAFWWSPEFQPVSALCPSGLTSALLLLYLSTTTQSLAQQTLYQKSGTGNEKRKGQGRKWCFHFGSETV